MAKTPKSADKKMKTLFSYFNKTPVEKQNSSQKLLDQKNEIEESSNAPKSKPERNLKVNPGDLVMAKLEGHPWWPSLVCPHPKEGKIWRTRNSTKMIHVQFFGSPPSRGWVKETFIKPFTGSTSKEYQKGGLLHSTQPLWKDAIKDADVAVDMGVDARLKLVVTMDSSDDDEDEDEVELENDDVVMEDDGRDGDGNSNMSFASKNLKTKKNGKENAMPDSKSSCSTPSRKSSRTPGGKRRRIIIDSDGEEGADDCDDDSNEDSFQPTEECSSSDNDDDNSESKDEEEDDDASNDEDDGSPIKGKKRSRGGKVKSHQQPTKKDPIQMGVKRNLNKSSKQNLKKFQKKKVGSNSDRDDDDNDDDGDKKITPSSSSSVLNKSINVSQSTKSKLGAFSASDALAPSASSSSPDSSERNFPHMTLKFLQPSHLKDASRKLKDDPDYDPKTLFVPEDFINKQTPAMKQWWILKSQYFDTILFFKMGKFYELFHMDAVIGVNELGLLFMKGEHAHCGFPEISYGRYSDILVQRGYKVARVEQTETPDQMQERCKLTKLSSKSDKVVRREICSVQSKGTKRSSFIDGDCSGTNHNFLLAIAEKPNGSGSTYGVCFVDVMIGKFHVGQFEDDRHGSRMRTLVSHYPPVQVLYERGKLSEKTRLMFNGCLNNCIKEGLKSSTEFWDAPKTLKHLSDSKYFADNRCRSKTVEDGGGFDDADDDDETSDSSGGGGIRTKWPEIFVKLTSSDDPLHLTPSPSFHLALSSLGAITWYLQHCLMDEELLSLKSFELYTPADVYVGGEDGDGDGDDSGGGGGADGKGEESFSSGRASSQTMDWTKKRMVLDGVTLVNLDVLINSADGSIEGTLLQKLDSCKTAFGKRLIKQWLCSPLCNVLAINDRLDAMDDLIRIKDVTSLVGPLLAKLPDLERLLNKIHTLGSSRRNKNHPDSRAVFFEDVIYSKRKIEDFLQTIEGFKNTLTIVIKFSTCSSDFKSSILKQCVQLKDDNVGDVDGGYEKGRFPQIKQTLDFFDSAFDHQKARSAGVIKPMKGVNKDYDRAISDIKDIEGQLNELLDDLKRKLNCKTLTYFGTARNRYQVEVPEALCHKVSNDFEVTSQRKGFKRYQSDEMKRLFLKLMDAEERRDEAQKDTMRCIFDQFDRHYDKWIEATQCIAVLDVLLSMATYSNQSDGVMCRPNVVPCLKESFIEIRNGRHPCIGGKTFIGGDYIPNDTVIGLSNDDSSSPRVLLVTGANMGGKSTLMRQVGLICLLSQLGCYVPAEVCHLTPVDRIFTRLGASDHIMSGESTFYVELSETSCVLQHATKHSLVLLDELGRGTATYDGNAIASAVLEELSDSIKCLTLFSTHYHSIVERFSTNRNVSLGHMACMVENEDDNDPTQETITFLFKLAPGNCPKSYGFNAARLAGIHDQIIREAHLKARQFEESVKTIKSFRNLWRLKHKEASGLSSIISQI